jgi:hypothetical protein
MHVTQTCICPIRPCSSLLGDALDDHGCDPLADDVELMSPDMKVPMATISAMGTGL